VTTPAAQNATSRSLPIHVDDPETAGQDPQDPNRWDGTAALHLRPGSVRSRPRSRMRAERAHGRAGGSGTSP
jgi:hypothetical protein